VTGSVITTVRDACRNGLLDWSPRLMLAMYACDIQASSESVDFGCCESIIDTSSNSLSGCTRQSLRSTGEATRPSRRRGDERRN
jgi:hypothetical protein